MTSPSKIIHIGLYNDRSTNDTVRANKFDLTVLNVHVGNPVFIHINVSKISNHALLVIRGTMVTSERVENTTSTYKSLREVAKDMNVETVLSRKKSFNGSINTGRGLFLSLRMQSTVQSKRRKKLVTSQDDARKKGGAKQNSSTSSD